MWHDRTYRRAFYEDLERLGLPVLVGNGKRGRSPNCARSTFLTLAVDDGARLEVLDRAVHTVGKGSTAERHYLRTFWPTLCAEVANLGIHRTTSGSTSGTGKVVRSQKAPQIDTREEAREISAGWMVPEKGVEATPSSASTRLAPKIIEKITTIRWSEWSLAGLRTPL